MFARYDSRELQATHYNGAWYVVRRDLYPHTSGVPWVTRQGEGSWWASGRARRRKTADSRSAATGALTAVYPSRLSTTGP